MVAIVQVHVQIIAHTIVVKQIVMEHVLVVQCFLALIALVKDPILVVIVGVVAKSGATMHVLENAEGAMVIVPTVVLVPPDTRLDRKHSLK